jgi:hypothetical protein
MFEEAQTAPIAPAEAPRAPARPFPPPSNARRDRLDSSHLPSPALAAARLAQLRLRVEENLRRSKAESTLRAYRSDFGHLGSPTGEVG